MGDLGGARALLEADLAATRRQGLDALTQRTLGSLFDLEYAAGVLIRLSGDAWERSRQRGGVDDDDDEEVR